MKSDCPALLLHETGHFRHGLLASCFQGQSIKPYLWAYAVAEKQPQVLVHQLAVRCIHLYSVQQSAITPLSVKALIYHCFLASHAHGVRHTSAAGILSMHRWYSLDYAMTIKIELPRKIRRLNRP